MNTFPKLLGGKCECSGIEGGCMYSDIGPWNPEGNSKQIYSPEIFDKVKSNDS